MSELVDGLLAARRTVEEASRRATPEDRELGALAALASDLSRIDVSPPAEFAEELGRRLSRLSWARRQPPILRASDALRAAVGRLRRSVALVLPLLRTAAAVVILAAAAAAVVTQLTSPRTASAAEILTRSESALARLVQPGQVMYRRWHVVERVRDRIGEPERVDERVMHEWMDGSDVRHVAGRSVATSGGLRLAYANVMEKGEYAPRVYFPPGFSSGPDGLLSIEPTQGQFQAALAGFEGRDRAILATYLARGYIYHPIVGERQFNRAILDEASAGDPVLPRIMLSLDARATLNGLAVYRVVSIDPARVRFRWTDSGPPIVWLERRETVRYISRDTFLSVRVEETMHDEMGRRTVAIRELIETRVLDAPAPGESPFDLRIPDGTPVRRQSAPGQLAEVARALRRVPAALLTRSGGGGKGRSPSVAP